MKKKSKVFEVAFRNRSEKENENCLAGMACPKCKSNGPFMIATTCWAQVHDDGVEDTSEHEWDENSACLCKDCKFSSKVGSFKAVLTITIAAADASGSSSRPRRGRRTRWGCGCGKCRSTPTTPRSNAGPGDPEARPGT